MLKGSIKSKKRFILTIITAFVVFIVLLMWLVLAYVKISSSELQMTTSQVLSEQYKLLYEQERNVILKNEELIDYNLELVLQNVSTKIRNAETLSVEYLETVREESAITGIWIIGEDTTVYLSSDNDDIGSTRSYVDRDNAEWETTIEWLLANEGEVWVDEFHKTTKPPYTYTKFAYVSLGILEALDSDTRVILEVGASIQDAFNLSNLKGMVLDNTKVSNNIVNVEFIVPDPSKKELPYEEGQTIRHGFVTTVINAKDLDGEITQIKVETQFKEKSGEVMAAFIITLLSSVLCLFVVIAMRKLLDTRNKMKEE